MCFFMIHQRKAIHFQGVTCTQNGKYLLKEALQILSVAYLILIQSKGSYCLIYTCLILITSPVTMSLELFPFRMTCSACHYGSNKVRYVRMHKDPLEAEKAFKGRLYELYKKTTYIFKELFKNKEISGMNAPY